MSKLGEELFGSSGAEKETGKLVERARRDVEELMVALGHEAKQLGGSSVLAVTTVSGARQALDLWCSVYATVMNRGLPRLSPSASERLEAMMFIYLSMVSVADASVVIKALQDVGALRQGFGNTILDEIRKQMEGE